MAGTRKRAGSTPKKVPKKPKTNAQPKVKKIYPGGAVETSFRVNLDGMSLSD